MLYISINKLHFAFTANDSALLYRVHVHEY